MINKSLKIKSWAFRLTLSNIMYKTDVLFYLNWENFIIFKRPTITSNLNLKIGMQYSKKKCKKNNAISIIYKIWK